MRQCKVFVHGVYAGILTETDSPREYRFKYDEKYRHQNGEPISLTMPLTDDTYRSKVLFPYFFNMLSEGENRVMQSSYLKINKDDDFGILLETACHDTPGAVTIEPIN